ncbi:hypothetical protein ANO11243_067810 [Dothideomycetidae sp. 11243]|nr:hypothetical protein ANO11243_067810 [fungal sp. No.11243]
MVASKVWGIMALLSVRWAHMVKVEMHAVATAGAAESARLFGKLDARIQRSSPVDSSTKWRKNRVLLIVDSSQLWTRARGESGEVDGDLVV